MACAKIFRLYGRSRIRMLLHHKVADLVRPPELVMKEKPAAIFKRKRAIEVLRPCSIVLGTATCPC